MEYSKSDISNSPLFDEKAFEVALNSAVKEAFELYKNELKYLDWFCLNADFYIQNKYKIAA